MSQGQVKYSPVTHGLYSVFSKVKAIDGRTKLGKAIRGLRKELVEHCGGEGRVSATQRLIIEQVISRAIRRQMYEVHILKDKEFSRESFLIALENGLSRDLNYLGIHAKEMEKVLDLESYIKSKEETKEATSQ